MNKCNCRCCQEKEDERQRILKKIEEFKKQISNGMWISNIQLKQERQRILKEIDELIKKLLEDADRMSKRNIDEQDGCLWAVEKIKKLKNTLMGTGMVMGL